MGIVKRQEWIWVVAVSAVIVAAASLPYLAGYLAQTPELRFSGSIMDQVDYNTYLAKMRQGFGGEWQYRSPFTTEEHGGAYVVTFYLALGHLARIAHLGLPLTYQIARVFFGFLMVLAIYRFIALFIPSTRTRRVAFLLATIASGLGWLTEMLAPTSAGGVSPVDFWLLDAFTYLAVLAVPHFCAAVALLLSIYILLLKRAKGPTLGEGVLVVLASAALGIIHPYALLLADAVPLLYWGVEALQTHRVQWRGIATVVVMGISQMPLLAYDLWVYVTQPVFIGWATQNVTRSPPPGAYLWGYGLLLALGIVGLGVWARLGWPGLAFPVIWIALVTVLIYVPWNLQRRFLEGVQVPLGLLAGVGLAQGLFPLPKGQSLSRPRWLVMGLLVAVAAMSNFYLTAGYTVTAATRDSRLFWSAEVLAGVDWLGKHTEPEDTVLSSFEVGNLIPGRIGHRVVLGHWMETVDYAEKDAAVARFFDADTSDEERVSLLEEYGVAYLFYGPTEQAMGTFDPDHSGYLVKQFCHDGVCVYAVQKSQGGSGAPSRVEGTVANRLYVVYVAD
jgi:hypothetical protein